MYHLLNTLLKSLQRPPHMYSVIVNKTLVNDYWKYKGDKIDIFLMHGNIGKIKLQIKQIFRKIASNLDVKNEWRGSIIGTKLTNHQKLLLNRPVQQQTCVNDCKKTLLLETNNQEELREMPFLAPNVESNSPRKFVSHQLRLSQQYINHLNSPT